MALPCTPVPARVAGVGHKKASGHTEDPNHQVKPWLGERDEETDKLKKRIEEKEYSINFLKKQVEKTDRSRYDICEVFSPLGFVSLRGITDSEEAGLWTSARVTPAPGDVTT